MASNKPPPNAEGHPSNPQVGQQPPDPQVKRYPNICVAAKPDDTIGRGHSIVVSRKIEPGEVISMEMPAVIYPASLSSICVFCSRCYRDLPSEPLRCSKCNLARFCSKKCLNSSHPKLLCNALPSLISGDHTLPEDCLFLSAEYKWSQELLFLLCTYSINAAFLLQLISLRTNLAFIPDDALVGTLHSQLISLLDPHLIPPHFSPEITSYLISNQKNNSYPRYLKPTHPQFDNFLFDGEYAYEIHLWFSALNHKCWPNAAIFYYDNYLGQNNVKVLRALHEINEGGEIFISRVHLNTKYSDRQMILMEDHGFKCDCVRCVIESKWKEQDKEPGEIKRKSEKRKKGKKGRKGRGIGGAEREVPEASGKQYPYSDFLERHVCDCGGCLVPFPSSDSRARHNLMECNSCDVVRKDKQAVAEEVTGDGFVRKDKQAVAEEVKEDEQAVAEHIRELMSKLLPKMSEKMTRMLLKSENVQVMEE